MIQVFRETVAALSGVYADAREARAVALTLFADAFGLDQRALYLGESSDFSAEQRRRLADMLRRLLDGEPVQYVTGVAHFCGRTLRVTPAVLIPRPETEQLARWVLSEMREALLAEPDAVPAVLDAGTGSGCIAITAALEGVGVVEAWDVSAAALEVARANALQLGAKVTFRQADLLASCHWVPEATGRRILVSNPPYVRQSEPLEAHVRREPGLALFVPDADPLLFYRALLRLADKAAVQSVGMEVNRDHAKEVAALFAGRFAQVEVLHDFVGNPRFVTGRQAEE